MIIPILQSRPLEHRLDNWVDPEWILAGPRSQNLNPSTEGEIQIQVINLTTPMYRPPLIHPVHLSVQEYRARSWLRQEVVYLLFKDDLCSWKDWD
jgi:hypothetical protein